MQRAERVETSSVSTREPEQGSLGNKEAQSTTMGIGGWRGSIVVDVLLPVSPNGLPKL